MDCKKVNINSVSQGTRVLSLKDCRKIVKFSSDVFRLYHVYEIKTSGSAPKQTNKQTANRDFLKILRFAVSVFLNFYCGSVLVRFGLDTLLKC